MAQEKCKCGKRWYFGERLRFTKNTSWSVIKNIGLKYLYTFWVKGYNFFQEIISCLFFNSLFYVFATKQQLSNEKQKSYIQKCIFWKFCQPEFSTSDYVLCIFLLGILFLFALLNFWWSDDNLYSDHQRFTPKNRTIEFEEYILKEDYHGKSSNKVPFLRDPFPCFVYWANVLITNWMNQKLDMNTVIQFPLRRHFELLWRHLAVTVLFTIVAIFRFLHSGAN